MEKVRDGNFDAMMYLTIHDGSGYDVDNESTIDEWPSRLAWKVVKKLLVKYKPNNNMANMEAQMMLNKVSMKSDDNLSVLFEQISQIQNCFGMAACTIGDGDLIDMVWKLGQESFGKFCICQMGSSTCSVHRDCKTKGGCCTVTKIISG